MDQSRFNVFNTNIHEVDRYPVSYNQSRRRVSSPLFQKRHKISNRYCKNKPSKIKMKNAAKKSKFKSITMHFMQNSSIYILNRIGNSSRLPQKVFWTLILIMGITGFVSQVSLFLIAYYEYPVVVNLNSINAEFQEFPAVTVCNLNVLRKGFEDCLEQNLSYDECANASYIPSSEITQRNFSGVFCNRDVDYEYLSENVVGNSSYLDMLYGLGHRSRMMYGHQAEDFILSCTHNFDGFECELQLSLSYLYGNCYTYNSGMEKGRSQSIGPGSGLQLELDIEIDEYSSAFPSAGVRVHIHDPYTAGNPDQKGFIARPGFETHVGVTKTMFSRLPPPYKNKCRAYQSGDSQEKCEENCFEDCTLRLCSCSMSVNIKDDGTACGMKDPRVLCCIEFCKDEVDDCDCPLACEESRFDFQISSSAWPSKSYYEGQKEEFEFKNESEGVLPYEKVLETRLRLEIYYESLSYTVYNQSPMYQSSDLFSQIGGQMGLWLGMSLVAFFECMDTCIGSMRFKGK